MDAARFDRLTRSLSAAAPRRSIVAGISAALGLAAIGIPASVQAKNKKRKKKVKKNQFGCVDVGKFCKNSGQCCSGICKGKKGKKKCKAHDTGDCAPGANSCESGGISCGTNGFCVQTTGKASFCGEGLGACFACTKDVDCEASKGPGAACVLCLTACEETGFRSCNASAA
jgi:hypothetical protein